MGIDHFCESLLKAKILFTLQDGKWPSVSTKEIGTSIGSVSQASVVDLSSGTGATPQLLLLFS